MNAQTVTIEVDPSSAAILHALMAKAEAQGETLAALLQPLVEQGEPSPAAPPRNEAMYAVLQRSAARRKDMPVSGSTEETLKMIRRARAGEIWGYEPTDTDQYPASWSLMPTSPLPSVLKNRPT